MSSPPMARDAFARSVSIPPDRDLAVVEKVAIPGITKPGLP